MGPFLPMVAMLSPREEGAAVVAYGSTVIS